MKFDLVVWKNRSLERLNKLQQKKKKRSEIEVKQGQDLLSISGLQKIIEWCNDKSLTVEFVKTSNGEFDPNTNTIKINSKSLPEIQLYWLLHECGHYLIEAQRVAHGMSDPPNNEKSLITRVEHTSEEIDAWNRGKKLAKRLGVYVNDNKFMKLKASALKTYFKWASSL